jgi:hypothetical protein
VLLGELVDPLAAPVGGESFRIDRVAPSSRPDDLVSIELPRSEPAPGYRTRHVELHLSAAQSDALAAIVSGLRGRHTQLASDRTVVNPADVIRWMLDQAIRL